MWLGVSSPGFTQVHHGSVHGRAMVVMSGIPLVAIPFKADMTRLPPLPSTLARISHQPAQLSVPPNQFLEAVFGFLCDCCLSV